MRINKTDNLVLSKTELEIITEIVAAFSQQIDWQYQASSDKEVFKKKFKEEFSFQLIELNYVISELWSLGCNLDNINLEEIYISLFQEQLPNKPLVIYTALKECNDNYEDYEISTIAGVYKQELDTVLKDFKEKVIDVIKNITEDEY